MIPVRILGPMFSGTVLIVHVLHAIPLTAPDITKSASCPENTAPWKMVSSPIIQVVWTFIVFEVHHLFPLIWRELLNLAPGERAFSASVVLLIK